MSHVREWVSSRKQALEQLIGQQIRETDFTDDRLAQVLKYLSQDSSWQSIERGISNQTIRVYDLEAQTVRLDATVAQTYHDAAEHQLFQVGRTKSNSYDVQFKIMLGSLDPMGMPLAVEVVSGEKADDPLYIPVYERIRQTLKKSGLLYVGDSKMGSVESRATIAKNGDYYLMP
jgi:transposase